MAVVSDVFVGTKDYPHIRNSGADRELATQNHYIRAPLFKIAPGNFVELFHSPHPSRFGA
jgi:hypothetical protein